MTKLPSLAQVAAVLLVAALAGCDAATTPPLDTSAARPGAGFDTVVDGQDDPAVDVPAVQAAVDAGGRVLLRGRFNFGEAVGDPYDFVANPPGSWVFANGPSHVPAGGTLAASRNPAFWAAPPRTVFVTTDVEIHGDGTAEIVGGYRTLTIGYRPLPGAAFVYDMNTDDGHLGVTTADLGGYPTAPARVVVSNVHFVGSLNASIWLAATEGETRVVGNRFSDLKPLVERYWFGRLRGNGVYTQGGVAALNLHTYLDTSVSSMQDVLPRSNGADSRTGTAVQGDLVLEDNAVETDAGGLVYAISLGGDVTVTGNTVRGGASAEQAVGIFGYFGRTVVERNHVESLLPMRLSEDSFGRNHPLTEAAGRTWAEGDWDRATTSVQHNTLVSHGLNALDVMISRDAVVKSNRLTVSHVPGVWNDGLYVWRSEGCTVQGNRVSGQAVFGIDLVESPSNVLVGNNLNGFEPQPLFSFLPLSHIAFLFGADGNHVRGGGANPRNVTYLEFLAAGNVVTGHGPIGPQPSDADHRSVVAEAMQNKKNR